MDYYYEQTCHHKEISTIKVVKYLLLCTLALLLLGLVTLSSRLVASMLGVDGGQHLRETTSQWSEQQAERYIIFLLTDYCAVFIITSIGLLATLKENFFFLIASAITNLVLSFISYFTFSYRWSIIFLQLCSSFFTLVYTLSFYLKMKLDIRRKKRMEKVDILRSQLMDHNITDHKGNLYQSSLQSHSYDKLVLTNEWLRSQQPPHEIDTRASTLTITD